MVTCLNVPSRLSLVLKYYSSFQDLGRTAPINPDYTCVAVSMSNLHSLFSFICVSYAYTYTGLCQQHKPDAASNNKKVFKL